MNKRTINVVAAVIIDDKDFVLCALRSDAMSHGGCWEFAGGSIEEGESPEEACRREIVEEFNCEIVVGDKILEHLHDYGDKFVNLTTFRCRLIPSNIPPTAVEHDELRWVSINDLNTLNWAEADIPTVELIMSEKTLNN